MPMVLKLNDEKVETLFSERDFEELIDKYMGMEAARYFRDLMDELNQYREEDKEHEQ